MITIQIKSTIMDCDLQFKFDTQERIVGFEIMGENTLSEEKASYFLANIPQTVKQLKDHCNNRKIEFTEIKPDLSFDVFWKRYGNTSGSRVKTEPIWNKLSEKDKNLAMNYISKYKQSLGQTTQAYAATYLNGKYWIK